MVYHKRRSMYEHETQTSCASKESFPKVFTINWFPSISSFLLSTRSFWLTLFKTATRAKAVKCCSIGWSMLSQQLQVVIYNTLPLESWTSMQIFQHTFKLLCQVLISIECVRFAYYQYNWCFGFDKAVIVVSCHNHWLHAYNRTVRCTIQRLEEQNPILQTWIITQLRSNTGVSYLFQVWYLDSRTLGICRHRYSKHGCHYCSNRKLLNSHHSVGTTMDHVKLSVLTCYMESRHVSLVLFR